MEHREESNLCAQMLGVSRNGAQRLGGGSEQNVVDDLLVLQGNGGNRLRKSEHHMKILGVEKLGLPVFQPLGASQRLAFWTAAMPTAVVTDALVVTAITVLDMTTKYRCSTQFTSPDLKDFAPTPIRRLNAVQCPGIVSRWH